MVGKTNMKLGRRIFFAGNGHKLKEYPKTNSKTTDALVDWSLKLAQLRVYQPATARQFATSCVAKKICAVYVPWAAHAWRRAPRHARGEGACASPAASSVCPCPCPCPRIRSLPYPRDLAARLTPNALYITIPPRASQVHETRQGGGLGAQGSAQRRQAAPQLQLCRHRHGALRPVWRRPAEGKGPDGGPVQQAAQGPRRVGPGAGVQDQGGLGAQPGLVLRVEPALVRGQHRRGRLQQGGRPQGAAQGALHQGPPPGTEIQEEEAQEEAEPVAVAVAKPRLEQQQHAVPAKNTHGAHTTVPERKRHWYCARVRAWTCVYRVPGRWWRARVRACVRACVARFACPCLWGPNAVNSAVASRRSPRRVRLRA